MDSILHLWHWNYLPMRETGNPEVPLYFGEGLRRSYFHILAIMMELLEIWVCKGLYDL